MQPLELLERAYSGRATVAEVDAAIAERSAERDRLQRTKQDELAAHQRQSGVIDEPSGVAAANPKTGETLKMTGAGWPENLPTAVKVVMDYRRRDYPSAFASGSAGRTPRAAADRAKLWQAVASAFRQHGWKITGVAQHEGQRNYSWNAASRDIRIDGFQESAPFVFSGQSALDSSIAEIETLNLARNGAEQTSRERAAQSPRAGLDAVGLGRLSGGFADAQWWAEQMDKVGPSVMARLARLWKAVSASDEAFLYPQSNAKDAVKLAQEMSIPGSVVTAEVSADGDLITLKSAGGRIQIVGANSRPEIYAAEAKSAGSKDGGGKHLYQVAFAWAHNNGVTIYPSEALSPINQQRRTSNMLASALRFSSTDHMLPDSDQNVDWKIGRTSYNIAQLAKREARNALSKVPALADLTFDFEAGIIRDLNGKTVTQADLETLLRNTPGAFEAGIGRTTAARAIITESAIREGDAAAGVADTGSAARRGAVIVANQGRILYSQQPGDADYMAAVRRGDMETAQRMVDAAAKAAGYKTEGYHGTSSDFTVFDTQGRGKTRGAGAFFTTNRSNAQSYGQRILRVFLKQNGPIINTHGANWNSLSVFEAFDVNGESLGEFDSFSAARRRAGADGSVIDYALTLSEDGSYLERDYDNDSESSSTDDIASLAKRKGFDSITFTNIVDSKQKALDFGLSDKARTPSQVIAVFNPDQIKSADPVTYDDAGNIIPLSQRFNERSNDIRFAQQPGERAIERKLAADPKDLKPHGLTDRMRNMPDAPDAVQTMATGLYATYTDAAAIADATRWLGERTEEQAIRELLNLKDGQGDKLTFTAAQLMVQRLHERGEHTTAGLIAQNLAAIATTFGQAIQSLHMMLNLQDEAAVLAFAQKEFADAAKAKVSTPEGTAAAADLDNIKGKMETAAAATATTTLDEQATAIGTGIETGQTELVATVSAMVDAAKGTLSEEQRKALQDRIDDLDVQLRLLQQTSKHELGKTQAELDKVRKQLDEARKALQTAQGGAAKHLAQALAMLNNAQGLTEERKAELLAKMRSILTTDDGSQTTIDRLKGVLVAAGMKPVAAAAHWLKGTPTATDPWGATVAIHNPQTNGVFQTKTENQAAHLLGAEAKKGTEVRTPDQNKINWFGAIETTIKDAQVRVVNDHHKTYYFRSYKEGVHMVIVENMKVSGSYGLVSQYAPESLGLEGARVEKTRPDSGPAAQGSPSNVGIPVQPQTQTAQAPTLGANAQSGSNSPGVKLSHRADASKLHERIVCTL